MMNTIIRFILPIVIYNIGISNSFANSYGCSSLFQFLKSHSLSTDLKEIEKIRLKDLHNFPSRGYMSSEKINVAFQDASEYRKFIGVKLYEDSIRLSDSYNELLEIGPGNGEVAGSFLKNRPNLLGSRFSFVEPNERIQFELKNKFPHSRIFSSSLESALVDHLQDSNFDLILANFSLHWVNDLDSVVEKLTSKLKINGIIAFSNTDTKRSFWAKIDGKVRVKFPGCSLFKSAESHSMTLEQWRMLFVDHGYKTLKEYEYIGVAATFNNEFEALSDLKRMAGSKYLMVSGEFSQEEIETYILDLLRSNRDVDGLVSISASGYSLILRRTGQ